MAQKYSRRQIYQIVKFVVLSAVIIYYLYFTMHMPASLVLILEILLFIKLLPVTKFVEGVVVEYFPDYENLNAWIKRVTLFILYVLIYVVLKFIIVNVVMIGIFNIPVEEQMYEFINQTLNKQS